MTNRNPGTAPSTDEILSIMGASADADANDTHAADANRTTAEVIDSVVADQLAAEANSPPASTLASIADDQRPISTESQEAVAALVLRDFGLIDDDDESLPNEAELDRLHSQDAGLTSGPAADKGNPNKPGESAKGRRIRFAQGTAEYRAEVNQEMADDETLPADTRARARRAADLARAELA